MEVPDSVATAVSEPLYVDLILRPRKEFNNKKIITERKHTRSENVNTLSVVGKVRPVIGESRSTDSHCLLSRCGRIVASVLVVVS